MCFCCSRIGENLEHSLPSLKELILTSNNIQELVSSASLSELICNSAHTLALGAESENLFLLP